MRTYIVTGGPHYDTDTMAVPEPYYERWNSFYMNLTQNSLYILFSAKDTVSFRKVISSRLYVR